MVATVALTRRRWAAFQEGRPVNLEPSTCIPSPREVTWRSPLLSGHCRVGVLS